MLRIVSLAAAAALAHAATMTFSEFKVKFNRAYANSTEEAYRARVFAETAAEIEAHNSKGTETYRLGINQFSDMTHEEFKATMLSRRGPPARAPASAEAAAAVAKRLAKISAPPASVDWRDEGAVTPVKNQGQCGSCWAFSTTFAVEGANKVNGGALISLSEQQLVSCDKTNAACNGGLQTDAIDWLAANGGSCTEASYPYTSGGGAVAACKKTCTPAVDVKGWIEVDRNNETALLTALALQPIALAVDASPRFWQSYAGGVVTSACKCTTLSCLDHAVGGVGYGTTSTGQDYYTVKNSWGESWGEAGYIRLGRGSQFGPAGQCGVQIDSQIVTQ